MQSRRGGWLAAGLAGLCVATLVTCLGARRRGSPGDAFAALAAGERELHTAVREPVRPSLSAPRLRSRVEPRRAPDPGELFSPSSLAASGPAEHGPSEPATTAPAPASGRSAPIPECDAELRLVGSAVNEAQPRLSLAVVRNRAGAFVIGIGGRIGDFTLAAIGPTRAELLRSTGDRCALSGSSPPASSIAAPPPAPEQEPRAEPKGKAVFSKEELAGGVRALGGGQYVIAKALLLKALGNPGGAAGGAWFRPFKHDGQSVGMEVRAVRDGTALAAMGIETGDVARTVNGIALDSPHGLLAALRAVRESDAISIGILRDGKQRDMRYLTE